MLLQKERPRFRVDIYRILGKTRSYYFDAEEAARSFGCEEFLNPNTYKVKIWDQVKGPVEPYKVTAPGLIVELV